MMAICLSSSSGVTSELPEPEPMIARSTSATHQGYDTAWAASAERSHRSKRQMKADSRIELRHDPARHGPYAPTDPLDRDRSHLLDLCLGIPVESCNRGFQQYLEGGHPLGVARQGHHGDYSAPESLSRSIRLIIADDD